MLSNDERDLFRLVAQSPTPVAMSDYFPVLNPPSPDMDEDHPAHAAWTEGQIAWYGVSISLYDKGLVRIVTPADGSHPDLVEPTPDGRTVLASTVDA